VLCGCSDLWNPFLAERDKNELPDGGMPPPTSLNADSGVCPNDNVCWQSPLPQGNRLSAVHAISEDDVWAVGNSGTVLHYSRGRWTQVSGKTTENLNDVTSTPGQNEVWIVGDNGTIVQGMPPDSILRKQQGIGHLHAVRSVHSQLAFASGENGAALRWDGTQWQQTSAGFPFTTYRGIVALDPDNVRVCVQSGQILRWLMQPDTNEPMNGSGTLMGMWGASPSNMWAVGEQGFVVVRRGTAAVPWKFLSTPSPANLNRIWGTGGADLWTVGNQGIIWRIDGNQETFAEETSGTKEALLGVSGTVKSDVWAVGERGTILHRDATGWTAQSRGPSQPITGLWAASLTDAWAVGHGGLTMHWNGQRWDQVPSGTEVDLKAISGRSGTDIWAVGVSGTLLHWDGQSWQKITPPDTRSLNGVYAASAETVWVVGASGRISEYQVASKSWKNNDLYTSDLYAISGFGANRMWTAGQQGKLARYNGTTWQVENNPMSQDLYAVWVSPTGSAWFVGAAGIVQKWDAATQTLITPTTRAATMLRAVWGYSDTRIYMAGDKGSLFHFDGTTWSELPTGTAYSLAAITGPPDGPTSNTRLWLGGDSGTILFYKE
jgi:hypothetical protein